MIVRKLGGKKLIHSSNNDQLVYGSHSVVIGNGDILTFTHRELTPLEIAEKTMQHHLFFHILRSCDSIIKHDVIPELADYRNKENLKVYFIETKLYFLVISFGEYQPTVFKLFIEGVFQKITNQFG